MSAFGCILVLFLSSLEVSQILAVDFSKGCPTYDDVGAKQIDLKQYEGLWYDFTHSTGNYNCCVNKYSGFQNSSGYYAIHDYVCRVSNGPVYKKHYLVPFSAANARGYTSDESDDKYVNYYLDIVYDEYSIELGCQQNSAGIQYFLFAITRSSKTDNAVVEKLEEFNKKFGLELNIVSNSEACQGLQ